MSSELRNGETTTTRSDEAPPTSAFTYHMATVEVNEADRLANKWVFSSSTSHHMTNKRDMFTESSFRSCSIPIEAVGCSLTATGVGDIPTVFTHEGRTTNLVLRNVLYAPDLAFNLLSLGRFDQMGYNIAMRVGKCSVSDDQGIIFVTDDYARITIPKQEEL